MQGDFDDMPQKSSESSSMMNDFGGVVFKGFKSGLALIIPEKGPFESCLQELKIHLEQSQDFFKGAKIYLKTGKRILKDVEYDSLTKLIQDFGLILQRYPEEAANSKNHVIEENDCFIPTITIKKTVRSGQRLTFDGNLVIMGDVNPGAEIVASGDIIVIGKLRGTAHAGAKGDHNAQIISFHLKPVQIRIAEVITRAPEQDQECSYIGPEIARIKDGLIIVERFKY